MARVVFTSNLQRHLSVPEREVRGATVRAALEEVFTDAPALRDYVLDEQGHLRKHVTIYVNGDKLQDRIGLSEAVPPDGEIYVLQALSGG